MRTKTGTSRVSCKTPDCPSLAGLSSDSGLCWLCDEHQQGHGSSHQQGDHIVKHESCRLCNPLEKSSSYGKAKKQRKPRPVPVGLKERELEPEKVMCHCGKAATDWTSPDEPVCSKHSEERRALLSAIRSYEPDVVAEEDIKEEAPASPSYEESDDDSDEEEPDEEERKKRSTARLKEAESHKEECECNECEHAGRCDCAYCYEDCSYERPNPDADGDGLCNCETCEDPDNCSAEHTCCQSCDADRRPDSEDEEEMKDAPASPSYEPTSPVAKVVPLSKAKDLVLQLSVYARQELRTQYGVNWKDSKAGLDKLIDDRAEEWGSRTTKYEAIIYWANQIKKEQEEKGKDGHRSDCLCYSCHHPDACECDECVAKKEM